MFNKPKQHQQKQTNEQQKEQEQNLLTPSNDISRSPKYLFVISVAIQRCLSGSATFLCTTTNLNAERGNTSSVRYFSE